MTEDSNTLDNKETDGDELSWLQMRVAMEMSKTTMETQEPGTKTGIVTKGI